MKEKRKMARFNLQLPTRVSVSDEDKVQKPIELISKNICAGGGFFETDKPFPLGTKLKIEVLLAHRYMKKEGGDEAIIKVDGFVARSDEKGMAIHFDEHFEILPSGR
jgi:hypothetical protein